MKWKSSVKDVKRLGKTSIYTKEIIMPWKRLRPRRQMNQGQKCQSVGCHAVAKCKGLCLRCYSRERYRRIKNVNIPKKL